MLLFRENSSKDATLAWRRFNQVNRISIYVHWAYGRDELIRSNPNNVIVADVHVNSSISMYYFVLISIIEKSEAEVTR